MQSDVLVIGAGIVGLATAYQLVQQYPHLRVVVVEKEAQVCQHQSGRNSGVLHSGIYYRPGSVKALTCREGKLLMQTFCERESVPHEICGKVIIATSEHEIPTLQMLYERGKANGVQCERIDSNRLRELEPYASGIEAIHVPEAGIVSFERVCERLAHHIEASNGTTLTHAKVVGIRENNMEVAVQTTQGELTARYVVNCAGLYSDRIVRLSGHIPPARIVPFRGEYYLLSPEARHLCRNLIYPVPDPRFPFLGVHFTRTVHGEVECGPNAVLAFAREGYHRLQINLPDLWETLRYSGFRRLIRKHWRTGLGELWRSFGRKAFARAPQRLVPEVRAEYLQPAPAGVRAQAVDPDGNLLDDFVWIDTPRMVHVVNAPSPAATASLAIGKRIVERLAQRF